jgi:thymidylate synthase
VYYGLPNICDRNNCIPYSHCLTWIQIGKTMKKLTENEKIELSCSIVHALAKQPDAYEKLCASYGVSRAFDLSDDNLRKEHTRIVRTLNPKPSHNTFTSVDDSYAELLKKLVTVAETEYVRDDRTNTGTHSIFGHQMRFDLSKQFPILSTKKVYMQGVVAELLWFLRGDTNTDYLNKHKCYIWNPNSKSASENNPTRFLGHNLGNMYGMAWRYLPCNPHGMIKLKRKEFIQNLYLWDHKQPKLDKQYDIAKVIDTNNSGKALVLGKQGTKYVVMFVNTGSFRLVNNISKSLKDLYAPSVEGVGYLGMEIDRSNPTVKALHRVWQDMLIRVYNPRNNHSNYKDVVVATEWLNFSNFLRDCYSMWGFQEYVDSGYQWQLDKDYFGSKAYSKDTCLFLPPDLNKSLNSGGTTHKMYEFDNIIFASRTALQLYSGKTRKANLPKDCVIYEDNSEYVYRPILWIDQVQRAIDTIKQNPNSRRIVVDAWNPRGEENAILGICHPMFQFYVKDGKLSCQLYQRSCDVFLGLPFNIASYALLTHIVAQECDLEVGEFVWTGGDVHLYVNHIEQAKEQLSRSTIIEQLPQVFVPNKPIEQLEPSDIEVFGYNPQPTIKAPVAV